MSLKTFVNSKALEDSPVGDFAKDLLRDPKFKVISTQSERLKYIRNLYLIQEDVRLARIEFLKEYKNKN